MSTKTLVKCQVLWLCCSALFAQDFNSPPKSADVVFPPRNQESVMLSEDTVFSFSLDSKESKNSFSFPFLDDDPKQVLSAVRINSLPTKGNLYLDLGDLGKRTISRGDTIGRANIPNMRFAPGPNEFGKDYSSFQFSVCDGLTYSTEPYTFTFDVTQVDDVPVAMGDRYLAVNAAGFKLFVPPNRGLLLNDSNSDQGGLAVHSINGSTTSPVRLPSGATIRWENGGGFEYQVAKPLAGKKPVIDRFTYSVVRFGTKKPSAEATVELELLDKQVSGNFELLADTAIDKREDQKLSNFGNETSLELSENRSIVLQFDIVRYRGEFSSAVLRLRPTESVAGASDCKWKMVSTDWHEHLLRYVDAPSASIDSGRTSSLENGDLDIDVTDAIRVARDLRLAKATFIIERQKSGTGKTQYASRENEKAGLRPQLEVSGAIGRNNSPTGEDVVVGSISECAVAGTEIVSLNIVDADRDTVFYEFDGGSARDIFSLTPEGKVMLRKPGILDYERLKEFDFTVTGSDMWGGRFRSSVSISATNCNESPIVGASGQRQFATNMTRAGVILDVIVARDPEQDPLEFSIIHGDPAGAFSIDSKGYLRVAKPDQIETKVYQLVIRVQQGPNDPNPILTNAQIEGVNKSQ